MLIHICNYYYYPIFFVLVLPYIGSIIGRNMSSCVSFYAYLSLLTPCRLSIFICGDRMGECLYLSINIKINLYQRRYDFCYLSLCLFIICQYCYSIALCVGRYTYYYLFSFASCHFCVMGRR